MPSIIQADQLKSSDGNTTYLSNGTLSNATLPTGTVLQVVYFQDTDQDISAFTTEDSWEPTGLTKAITTKADNSNIYISATVHAFLAQHTDNTWNALNFRINKGSNAIWYSNSNISAHNGYYYGRYTDSDSAREMKATHMSYLDTGNTANAGTSLTYSVSFSNREAMPITFKSTYGVSQMTLMEVMP